MISRFPFLTENIFLISFFFLVSAFAFPEVSRSCLIYDHVFSIFLLTFYTHLSLLVLPR